MSSLASRTRDSGSEGAGVWSGGRAADCCWRCTMPSGRNCWARCCAGIRSCGRMPRSWPESGWPGRTRAGAQRTGGLHRAGRAGPPRPTVRAARPGRRVEPAADRAPRAGPRHRPRRSSRPGGRAGLGPVTLPVAGPGPCVEENGPKIAKPLSPGRPGACRTCPCPSVSRLPVVLPSTPPPRVGREARWDRRGGRRR